MKFLESVPIGNLVPAPYNPRKIDEESFASLVESIESLGVIRPIIITDKMTILAGHQRTRAMKAAGLSHTPAFMATDEVSQIEEMRFNQYHNEVDVDDENATVTVPPGEGWEVVDPAEIVGWDQVRRNAFKNAMGNLVVRHGPWSNAIATESGRILVGSLYAAIHAGIGIPLLVRYVPDDQAEEVLTRFGREYGEFSYSHIPMDQWAQAGNQPYRIVKGYRDGVKVDDDTTKIGSTIYLKLVIPRLQGNERILDFGSGRGAFAKALRSEGHQIIDVEFYRRRRGSYDVDHVTVQRQIDELCDFIARGQRFDVAILDSVLNSVGVPEAQDHCMAIVNALTSPGGMIAFSGKSLDWYEHAYRSGSKEHAYRELHVKQNERFFDKDGRSAIYNRGAWYFQKYHRLAEVEELARTYVGPSYQITNLGTTLRPLGVHDPGSPARFRSSEMWQCNGVKQAEVSEAQLIAAVEYEFSLPYKSGRTVGRVDDVLHALKQGGFIK